MGEPMKDAELRKALGKAAREARIRAKLTQADVAERVELASEVYGRLERGIMLPSVPTLRRLSLALGVSADELLSLQAESGAVVPEPLPPEDPPEIRRLLRRARAMNPRRQRLLASLARELAELGPEEGEREEGA
jgi:transcriptional regulator with XRE-family HTH domain